MNYLGYQNQGFQNQGYQGYQGYQGGPGYPNPNIGLRFPGYNGQVPTGPPRYGVGLPGAVGGSVPSYNGANSSNDPTLQAGASGSYGGGDLPQGAIPMPWQQGNMNMRYAQGYRKQFINGKWYLLPPTAGQAMLNQPTYQPM